MTPPTRLRARFPQPLLVTRIACAASLVGALTAASPALAAGQAPPAAPPGQKPPCVPAMSYLRGYDCELFPLPALPAKPGAPEAAPVVVAVVPVVPVAAPAPVAPPGPPPVAVAPVAVPGAAPPALPDAPVAAVPVVPAVAVVPPPVPTDNTQASASPSHAPAYAAFVVGAAGVGMTAAFGILALSTNSTLSKDCTGGGCPAKDSSNVSNLKLYDNLADIGLGVAAAGIITGIVLYVTEKPSSSGGTASARPRERHIEPWLGLGSGGVRGSF